MKVLPSAALITVISLLPSESLGCLKDSCRNYIPSLRTDHQLVHDLPLETDADEGLGHSSPSALCVLCRRVPSCHLYIKENRRSIHVHSTSTNRYTNTWYLVFGCERCNLIVQFNITINET